MLFSASVLTLECPHCKNKEKHENVTSITKLTCTACKGEIPLPDVARTIVADEVTVISDNLVVANRIEKIDL